MNKSLIYIFLFSLCVMTANVRAGVATHKLDKQLKITQLSSSGDCDDDDDDDDE